VTAAFSAFQDSSAGLKRAHAENTFIWASLSAGGGTVFRGSYARISVVDQHEYGNASDSHVDYSR